MANTINNTPNTAAYTGESEAWTKTAAIALALKEVADMVHAEHAAIDTEIAREGRSVYGTARSQRTDLYEVLYRAHRDLVHELHRVARSNNLQLPEGI
jgi:hypothetical protein